MTRLPQAAALVVTILVWPHTPKAAVLSSQAVIGQFAAIWGELRSYACTVSVQEVKGNKAQNRVYHVFFQKPLNTRVEIVQGDHRGSVGVWTGGSRIHGHQGGILSMIKLNLDIHDPLAVTLRGATIAQVNLGYMLQHLRSIDPKSMMVSGNGRTNVITAQVSEPAPDDDVKKEVFVFSDDGLPLKVLQYGGGDVLLKQLSYSDVRVNIPLPPSTWTI